MTHRSWARPDTRGLIPVYSPGMACPGCGSTHWHVGRVFSECARCGVALAIVREVGR